MDFSKLLHGFVKIDTWISRSLLNKTKLTFDQDFKACRSFCFEMKMLNGSKYSMPWVRYVFGNVYKGIQYLESMAESEVRSRL